MRLKLSLFFLLIFNISVQAQAAPRAYIANQMSNSLSVLDTGTQSVVATIPLGSFPTGVAVTPRGNKVFVSNQVSGTLSVIDTSSNSVSTTFDLGENPTEVILNPAGTRLYVSDVNQGFGNTVWVLDAATNQILTSIVVGPSGSQPQGLAISADDSRLYVANYGGNTVAVVDTATNTVITQIPVPNSPLGIALHPDGTRLYVSQSALLSTSVAVIDTSNNSIVGSIAVGSQPMGIAVHPSGDRLLVANMGSKSVSVVDTHTNMKLFDVPVGLGPRGIAFNADGSRAYVTNYYGGGGTTVSTLETNILNPITVGNGPVSLARFLGPDLTPPSALSSSSLDFGDQAVGTVSAEQTVTLTNQGQAPVSLQQVTITADYEQQNDCGNSLASGTCTFRIQFRPALSGARNGALILSTSGASPTQVVLLNGNGTGNGNGSGSNNSGTGGSAGAGGCSLQKNLP